MEERRRKRDRKWCREREGEIDSSISGDDVSWGIYYISLLPCLSSSTVNIEFLPSKFRCNVLSPFGSICIPFPPSLMHKNSQTFSDVLLELILSILPSRTIDFPRSNSASFDELSFVVPSEKESIWSSLEKKNQIHFESIEIASDFPVFLSNTFRTLDVLSCQCVFLSCSLM